MRSKRLHGRPSPLPPWPSSAQGPMEPKTQAASLPKPLWPPNTRPPCSPFPRVLCGDECKPKTMGEPQAGRATGWERHGLGEPQAERATGPSKRGFPAYPQPPVVHLPRARIFLYLQSPGFCHLALVGKEELLLQALYYSNEDNGVVSLGPFVCLSQYESGRDQYGMCLRARRTGRNSGEGEKGELLTLNMLREA